MTPRTPTTEPPPKCLNPVCPNQAKQRGLCNRCYLIARGLVIKKKTTWQELEAAGKLLPPRHGTLSKATTDWLLTPSSSPSRQS